MGCQGGSGCSHSAHCSRSIPLPTLSNRRSNRLLTCTLLFSGTAEFAAALQLASEIIIEYRIKMLPGWAC